MIGTDDMLGLILAGGRATRMGGGDKGRLALGSATLVESVIGCLKPQVGALALSANGDPARFADLGLPVLADSVPGQPGPLAGILAGMDLAAREGRSHVLSAAADTPFLPPDLAQRLSAGLSEAPIVMAASAGTGRPIRQPVIGLWPVALREDLRAALNEGVSKVGLWAGRHGIVLAVWPTDPVDPFFNVNTPEDLAIARQIARG